PGEAGDLAAAAKVYGEELVRVAGKPPRLDYVLLGVGPDGHVASLFPDHKGLRDKHPALAVEDAPMPPPRRLSLSLRVLGNAGRVVIAAFGATKARVVAEVAKDIGSSLPVAQVARAARRCMFLIDREAGSQLSE